MNPLSPRPVWIWQKNRHVVESLLRHNAPAFVWQARPAPLAGELPVFTFHEADPLWFDEQCRFLAENDYRALSSEEFAAALRGESRPPARSVLLTFDDGLRSVWSVAFPLLRKYGLRATCFLIPGCVAERAGEGRPTLEDRWAGRATLDEVARRVPGPAALADWREIRAMHESGVLDFQSHTMYHALVFSGPQLYDFAHPGYDPYYYGNVWVPIYTVDGRDVPARDPLPGMPIYRSRPRMQAERRFFDDERLRGHCLRLVEREGGDRFFEAHGWRRRLRRAVAEYRRSRPLEERWERPEERDRAVEEELRASREAIEQHLPGRRVDQLCFPWYRAAPFAVEAARRAGFGVQYFGQLPGRPTNRPGDDPHAVVRVEDTFLQRLPGRGRRSLATLLARSHGRLLPQPPAGSEGARA